MLQKSLLDSIYGYGKFQDIDGLLSDESYHFALLIPASE